jgi:hypothetical protein
VKARSLVTPLVLVVLAVGTAAYAYLVDRATVSDADRSLRRSDVFPSFRVDEVSRLEVVHGEESTVLERDADAGGGTAWTMVSPRRERADPAAVDVLLRELELATRLREVGTGDAAGLDAPRARGKVQLGALAYRFALGGDAPRPEGAAYMRIDGEGTFVIDRSLKVQLLRGADAYRERALVPYGASGIARLEVRAASGASFALDRVGATFRVAGLGLRASRSAVDELMATLADGRAETFLDDATADRATASAAFTVTVAPRDAGREAVTLRLGGECPGQPGDVVVVRNLLALALAQARGSDVHRAGADDRFEARARVTLVRTGGQSHEVVELGASSPDGTALMRRADDGAVLRVSLAVARRFEAHPVALRARQVWGSPFEAGAVVAIDDTCTPAAEHLELRDRTWTLRAPAGLPADAVSVADLLGTLSQLKADAWIAEADDGAFGFDGPGACAVVLTLDAAAGDAGPRRVALALGAAGDGGFYARTPDDRAVFVASPGLRQVLAHPAIDRSRFHIDTTRATSVAVLRGGMRQRVSSDAGADEKLEAAVDGLFAESALHGGPALAEEGLDHPTLELVVTSRTDAAAALETRIVVGAETQVDGVDAYFARVSGIEATFDVPKGRVTAILDAL